MRLTTSRAIALGAGAMLLATAAIAVAVTGGDPKQPTRSSSPLVSIGQPISPYRAGNPAEGWIEMRAPHPTSGEPYAVLYHEFSKRRRGRSQRHTCAEVGPERRARAYPVRDGGSCVVREAGGPASPLGFSWGSSDGGVVQVHGQASPEVRRVVVNGPGGTYEVPLSRHRAFLLLYSSKARGTATLAAHLRDGSTRFWQIRVAPEFSMAGRGSATAHDSGGRGDWSVSANLRRTGPREGQTCAQFNAGRPTLEAAAPMCGNLAKDAIFADATHYGPRPARGAFSPGPRSPKRLIVWGAVAPSVRAVRIAGPGGTRSLELSEVGRAFIAVYPASVKPAAITLAVTLGDGTVQRHRAPRRLNAVTLAAQPELEDRRIGLRTSRSDPSKIVLMATLDRPASRFEVTLQGREVRMRRTGGPDDRPRYTGIYDRDRGVRRSFETGKVYGSSAVLCGGDACVLTRVRSRLR